MQWRVLVRTYVTIDFRPTGGAVRHDGKGRSGMAPLSGLLFISAIGGVAFAFIAVAAPDALVSASCNDLRRGEPMMILFASPDRRPRTDSPSRHRRRLANYFAARSAWSGLRATITWRRALPAIGTACAGIAACRRDARGAALRSSVGSRHHRLVVLLRGFHRRICAAMSYSPSRHVVYVMYDLATTAFQSRFSPTGVRLRRWLWAFRSPGSPVLAVAAGRRRPAWLAAAAAAVTARVAACGASFLDYARRTARSAR